MKKRLVYVLLIIISLIIVLIFSGCIENNEENNSVSYDFFVDLLYNENTNGWKIDHFNSINDAINNSINNTSIFVYSGIYYEAINIDKTIVLQGEDVYTTIISGTQLDDVIHVEGNGKVTLSNFTIRDSSIEDNQLHSQAGIDIRSSGNKIMYNIFKANSCGIYSRYADNNQILKNKFIDNDEYGIYLDVSSDENHIFENLFINNSYALRVKGSKYSDIDHNIFFKNFRGLYFCCGAKYNVIFANIFCNNSKWDANDHYDNLWHNEVPLYWHSYRETKSNENIDERAPMGNYWDTFHLPSQDAFDNDNDGIIDRSYRIQEVYNFDEYPLAMPPTIQNPFIELEEILIEC
jgi:parallel beta-helix repeat protein